MTRMLLSNINQPFPHSGTLRGEDYVALFSAVVLLFILSAIVPIGSGQGVHSTCNDAEESRCRESIRRETSNGKWRSGGRAERDTEIEMGVLQGTWSPISMEGFCWCFCKG